MKYIAFRNLIGVTHTEEEVKALSSEYEYVDGPNDQGEMYTRSGKVWILFVGDFISRLLAKRLLSKSVPKRGSCPCCQWRCLST
jgi:cytochrome c1